MIYFSLARETTDLLCYTIFHTLIDKRRKEISLFSTKTFYKSSLYKTFLSSRFISKGETKTVLSIINGDCPFMPLTPYNLFQPLRHFVTPPLLLTPHPVMLRGTAMEEFKILKVLFNPLPLPYSTA